MFCDKHNAELRSRCISPGLAPAPPRRSCGLGCSTGEGSEDTNDQSLRSPLESGNSQGMFDAVGGALPAKLSLEESFYVFPCCNLRFNPHLTQTGIFQEECHA